MTQQSFSQPDVTTGRYPLSYTQQYFHSLDEGDLNGAFGNRFTIVSGVRIAGHVDVEMLQGALDDVIERHELLRTVVVRDTEPPYQQVYPPCRVPLEVRDYPVTERSRDRDAAAEELLIEGERETLSARRVPAMQAAFTRFDDADSVLVIVVHHSASDAWSQAVVLRDLAAFYDARVNHHPVDLPPLKQYRDYAEWQEAGAAETSEARQYWRKKLRDAQVLALPNDRPRPEVYTRPFSGYHYMVSADDMAAARKLSQQTRSSMFMVMMAAFSVFSYQLTGRADPAIRAFTTGRDEPTFRNTMGLFLNVVPFQTDISGCLSYREIVASTRETCIDAYTHEVPISVIEHDLPHFNAPHDAPRNSQLILGMYQALAGDEALPLAGGAREFFKQTLSTQTSDIPSGMVWNMTVTASGVLIGDITYNLDEFDEEKVTGWVADYNRILSQLVSEPDRAWRQLVGVSS